MKTRLLYIGLILLIVLKCNGDELFLKEVTYDLLDDLYCTISSDTFQTKPDKLNAISQLVTKNFTKSDAITGIHKIWSTLDLNVRFEKTLIDDDRLSELNDVFTVALSSPEITCEDENRLILKGHFIKFSQIAQNSKKCAQKLKSVEIYASDTIFMDTERNFATTDDFQLIIIAPNWFIRDTQYQGGTIWVRGDFWPIKGKSYDFENNPNTGNCESLKDPYRYPKNYDFPLINRGNFFGVAENLHYGSVYIDGFGPTSFFGLNQNFSCKIIDRRIDWGIQKVCKADEDYKENRCVKYKCGQIQGPIDTSKSIKFARDFIKATIEKHPILRIDATGFLIKLIGTFNSENIENIFDLVQILKKNHVSYEDRMQLLYLYKELSRSIEKKACSTTSREEIKVLYHLHISILDKISTLEDSAFGNYVTNLRDFSDYIVKSMNEIKNTGDKVLVDRYQNDYQKELDNKINESSNLVQEHIVPRIKAIAKDLEKQMDDLLDEIVQLQKEAEKNKELLIEKKAQLERVMRARIAMGVLDLFGTAVSFLGPVGKVIGTTVKIGTKIAEAGIPDINTDSPDLPDIYREKISKDALRLSGDIKTGIDLCDKKKRAKRDAPSDDEESAIEKIGRYTEIADAIAGVGVDIYKKYKQDKSKIDIVDEQIEMIEKYIKQLLEIKNDFCTNMKPVLRHISNELQNLHISLTNKTVPQLDIASWQIESNLKQVKNYMNDVYTGFKSNKKIQFSIDELSDAVTTMINIYKGMEKYRQEQKLVEYVANVNSKKFTDIAINDKNLNQRFYETLLYLKSSLIFKEYRRYIDAIKQYSFPLADIYLKTLAIPFKYEFVKSYEESVRDAIDSIKQFRYKIWESTTTINKYDHLKYSAVYFGTNDTNGPFFVWKNREYINEIGKLLSGEEISLTSDIDASTHRHNAIKFNIIDLRFKVNSDNVSITEEVLNKALDDFQITMKHTGNSYYKCNNKTYIITTDNQLIEYGFKRNLEGVPTIRNEVYDKIKSGDYVLSPFTTWKMKISLIRDHEKDLTAQKFNNLKRFVEHVDLTLIGRGQYYKEDSSLCSHDLGAYYEEDIPVININPYIQQCPKYRRYYDGTGKVEAFYKKW